jgi:urease accessory protein
MNLRLLQLGDSALPIGGYSHSWGLEAAIERQLVTDAISLEQWTRSWLHHAIGPLEATVVAAVCRCKDGTAAIDANELLWAGIVPSTLRHASRDLGEQLLMLAEGWSWAAGAVATLRSLAQERSSPAAWHHAPVFATLAAAAGATPVDAVAVYLHQAVLAVIGAGVRAIPIGHTHGQQILAHLLEDIEALAAAVADSELETAGSNCPAYEVLCHVQERLYTRLFRS